MIATLTCIKQLEQSKSKRMSSMQSNESGCKVIKCSKLQSAANLCLGGSLPACPLKLLMTGDDHHLGLLRAVAELEQDLGGLEHSSVAAADWIYYLKVTITTALSMNFRMLQTLLIYDPSVQISQL